MLNSLLGKRALSAPISSSLSLRWPLSQTRSNQQTLQSVNSFATNRSSVSIFTGTQMIRRGSSWLNSRGFHSTASLYYPTTKTSSVQSSPLNSNASENKSGDENSLRISDKSSKNSVDQSQVSRKPTKLPIVLLHGLFGFDKLGPNQIPTLQIHYWKGIASALEAHGHTVYVARVPAVGSIAERAEALDRYLKTNLNGQDVNLIGHSLGGLDGRYLITHLMSGREYTVRSLTTVATPHRGSPFMDWIRDMLGVGYAPELKDDQRGPRYSWLTAFDKPAFGNLTTEFMTQHFNPTTPNHPNVFYQSYGAHMDFARVHPLSVPSAIVRRQDGLNDGFVSVQSARWGEYVQTLNADHFMLNKRASQHNASTAVSQLVWNNRAVNTVRDTAQAVGGWASMSLQAIAPVVSHATMAVGQFWPPVNMSGGWLFSSSGNSNNSTNQSQSSSFYAQQQHQHWNDDTFLYGVDDNYNETVRPDTQQQFDAPQFYLDVAERLRQRGL